MLVGWSRFWRFWSEKSTIFYISFGHQHLKDVTNIKMQSPTSADRHPLYCQQHHCGPWWYQFDMTSRWLLFKKLKTNDSLSPNCGYLIFKIKSKWNPKIDLISEWGTLDEIDRYFNRLNKLIRLWKSQTWKNIFIRAEKNIHFIDFSVFKFRFHQFLVFAKWVFSDIRFF